MSPELETSSSINAIELRRKSSKEVLEFFINDISLPTQKELNALARSIRTRLTNHTLPGYHNGLRAAISGGASDLKQTIVAAAIAYDLEMFETLPDKEKGEGPGKGFNKLTALRVGIDVGYNSKFEYVRQTVQNALDCISTERLNKVLLSDKKTVREEKDLPRLIRLVMRNGEQDPDLSSSMFQTVVEFVKKDKHDLFDLRWVIQPKEVYVFFVNRLLRLSSTGDSSIFDKTLKTMIAIERGEHISFRRDDKKFMDYLLEQFPRLKELYQTVLEKEESRAEAKPIASDHDIREKRETVDNQYYDDLLIFLRSYEFRSTELSASEIIQYDTRKNAVELLTASEWPILVLQSLQKEHNSFYGGNTSMDDVDQKLISAKTRYSYAHHDRKVAVEAVMQEIRSKFEAALVSITLPEAAMIVQHVLENSELKPSENESSEDLQEKKVVFDNTLRHFEWLSKEPLKSHPNCQGLAAEVYQLLKPKDKEFREMIQSALQRERLEKERQIEVERDEQRKENVLELIRSLADSLKQRLGFGLPELDLEAYEVETIQGGFAHAGSITFGMRQVVTQAQEQRLLAHLLPDEWRIRLEVGLTFEEALLALESSTFIKVHEVGHAFERYYQKEIEDVLSKHKSKLEKVVQLFSGSELTFERIEYIAKESFVDGLAHQMINNFGTVDPLDQSEIQRRERGLKAYSAFFGILEKIYSSELKDKKSVVGAAFLTHHMVSIKQMLEEGQRLNVSQQVTERASNVIQRWNGYIEEVNFGLDIFDTQKQTELEELFRIFFDEGVRYPLKKVTHKQ